MKTSALKKELIINAAQDIVEYLDEHHAIDAEIYDIAELININLGFIFQIAEETIIKSEEKNEQNQ